LKKKTFFSATDEKKQEPDPSPDPNPEPDPSPDPNPGPDPGPESGSVSQRCGSRSVPKCHGSTTLVTLAAFSLLSSHALIILFSASNLWHWHTVLTVIVTYIFISN
jgi:hypothetical protein